MDVLITQQHSTSKTPKMQYMYVHMYMYMYMYIQRVYKRYMYVYVYDKRDQRLNTPVEYLSAMAKIETSEKLEHEDSDIVGV